MCWGDLAWDVLMSRKNTMLFIALRCLILSAMCVGETLLGMLSYVEGGKKDAFLACRGMSLGIQSKLMGKLYSKG